MITAALLPEPPRILRRSTGIDDDLRGGGRIVSGRSLLRNEAGDRRVMPAIPQHLVRRTPEADMSPRGRTRAALSRTHDTVPRTRVDLRKLRESLGLTAQYVAALAGITDMTLLRCEERQDDREMVEDLLAVYAMYMATRWGADLLNLTEANLTETSR